MSEALEVPTKKTNKKKKTTESLEQPEEEVLRVRFEDQPVEVQQDLALVASMMNGAVIQGVSLGVKTAGYHLNLDGKEEQIQKLHLAGARLLSYYGADLICHPIFQYSIALGSLVLACSEPIPEPEPVEKTEETVEG